MNEMLAKVAFIKKRWLLLLVLLIVAGLTIAPFFLHPAAAFSGTDDKASEAIGAVQPGFKPWISPLWEPPGAEVESLLFSLQAALGAGVAGYYFGFKHGERKTRRKDQENTSPR